MLKSFDGPTIETLVGLLVVVSVVLGQGIVHALQPTANFAGFDANVHDVIMGCIGFIGHGVLRAVQTPPAAPPPAATAP